MANRTIARFAGIAAGAAMVLGVASPAAAQTAAQLQAQIAALMAQLQALQGGATSATITSDLTVGSTGSQVVALQSALVAQGYLTMPAGVPMGYFGALTKDAVMKWQAAMGLPSTGYFGPLSRAKFGGTTGGTTTGGTTTGGTTTGGTTSGPLTGGAGSIESFTAISSLSGEEVGEGEEDVEIAGVEVEVDEGSDIRLTAVRLDFSTQPGNDDLQDFITEVAIMLDGDVVARVDADEFNDDNDWTKTVSLDSSAVIRAGDTADLTVAVSGVNNIDTDDAGDNWALDFINVRYVDAQGASITDTITYTPVTWSVNTFATAADIELSVSLTDDEVNDAHVVNVDATSDTDGVEILSFTLEAENSDVTIDDLPIVLTTTGTANDPIEITGTIYLFADGVEIDSVTVGGAGDNDDSEVATFEDLDYEISDGDEVTFVVKADINDIAADFAEGDTLSAQITSTQRDNMLAEDETGEAVADADKTGTALADAIAFYDVGVMVTFVSATETVQVDDGADDDSGTFVLKFRVESFDGTVYVSDTGAATIATDVSAIDSDDGGILYRLEKSGTATAEDVSSLVTFTTSGGGEQQANDFELEDGESTEVTLTVIRTNDGETDDNGIYAVEIAAIGWSTTADDDTMEIYEFNLDDFKTDPVSLN